ncbi:hypothetical protein OSTOST_13650 [Ostertagia ostertagi]
MEGIMGTCLEGTLMNIMVNQTDLQPCRGRVLNAKVKFGCVVLLSTRKSSEHHITVQCLFDSSVFPTTVAKPSRPRPPVLGLPVNSVCCEFKPPDKDDHCFHSESNVL